ncbi:Phosphatase slingshot 2 protein [Globisporangium polare]
MASDAEPTLILAHLFLGSKAHARDRELLQRLKITHILNVTPPKTVDPAAGVPNFFEKDKSFTYRRCPIFDNKAEDISGVLEGCVAFMDQAKYYGRILVHCSKGVSRSTSMVVAYLMKIQDMSFDEALQFVSEKRPVANPNASFRRQLQEYDQKLRRSATVAGKGKSVIGAAVRGPQGPSLPPSTDNNKSNLKNASIGPQLPPHLQRKPQEEPKKDDDATATDDVDEPVATIGPSFPPYRKRHRSEDDDDASAAIPQKNESIGPQLPPHLQRKVVEEAAEDVVEPVVIIGPSLPPSHKRHREATT